MWVWFIAQTMVEFCMAIGVQGLSVACLLVGPLCFKYNSCNSFFILPPIFNLRLYHKGNQLRKWKSARRLREWIIWKGLIRSFQSQQSKARGQFVVCFMQTRALSSRFAPESGLLNWGHSVLKLESLSLFSYYVWAGLFCLITKTWWCQKPDKLWRDWKSGFGHVYFLWCFQFHWRNWYG